VLGGALPHTIRARLSSVTDRVLGVDVIEDLVEAFVRARADVLERIEAAAERVGRDPAKVTLVAVSKTNGAERVRAAIAAGLTDFGENRVQEAADKIPAVDGGRWHLIGPLQSNKARRALELFDVIESVDSMDLARRLDRIAGEIRPGTRYPVLIQVNVADDPAKAGFEPADAATAMEELLGLPNLRVEGLMTIGRLVASAEAARPTFVALRELGDRLRASHPALGRHLSMGMTDDFDVAVEEGATIVRVGRAVFGERPPAAA
jgi:pyridoxal phosphate enzyme (YggS family)